MLWSDGLELVENHGGYGIYRTETGYATSSGEGLGFKMCYSTSLQDVKNWVDNIINSSELARLQSQILHAEEAIARLKGARLLGNK